MSDIQFYDQTNLNSVNTYFYAKYLTSVQMELYRALRIVKCKPEFNIQIQSKWHPIYILMHICGLVAQDSSVHVVHQCMSCLCDFES